VGSGDYSEIGSPPKVSNKKTNKSQLDMYKATNKLSMPAIS